MVSIFIVEDHPVVRRGYEAFIAREPNLKVCGEAVSGSEALTKIQECRPDAVVLDVSLPGDMNGVDLLRVLKQRHPDLPVLVVSGNDEAIYGDLVVKCGAWGYVMKGNAEVFIESVRRLVEHVRQTRRQLDTSVAGH
jgi:two-component system, NarL family, invasion response regulator UvrY